MSDFNVLLDGYRRFRSDVYNRQRARYDALSHVGQSPGIMVIACCDSRVDPTVIFDAEPGQIFVVRNVANLVPSFQSQGNHFGGTSAALEFAVLGLKVAHIVVLGHAQCGGIRAAIEGNFDEDGDGPGRFNYIGRWMSLIRPTRDKVMAAYRIMPDMDPQRALEQAAIRQSLDNLRSFPFVDAAIRAGALALHGAYFGIADGILHVLSGDAERFEPVSLDWEEVQEQANA